MHHGFWPAAIFMIVIASWIFYRYAAPKRWRDWSRAGLVQAFIIALYAEMYGFPLTLYLLARLFHIDTAFASGNLWSNLFGHGETAMVIAMAVGLGFVAVGVYLLAQGWRIVYRASRQRRLATEGVYSLVRHPQYMGIFLALFGEGVVHWPTLFSITLFPLIVLSYVLLARKEERHMIEKYGDDYRAYRNHVPMFFPRCGDWRRLAGSILSANDRDHARGSCDDSTHSAASEGTDNKGRKTMSRVSRKKVGTFARVFLVIALVLSVGSLAVSYIGRGSDQPATRDPVTNAADGSGWQVGQLRENGLRIRPSGRSDASAVLDPEQFTGRVRHAYWIATQIPEVLNQLYCWCGCIDRGEHRSSLQCFEDRMGVTCEVCQRTAEIAHELVQKGIPDTGRIQAQVDSELARPRASKPPLREMVGG